VSFFFVLLPICAEAYAIEKLYYGSWLSLTHKTISKLRECERKVFL